MLSKMIDIHLGPCIMGPIETELENKMKKVSTGEKLLIIGVCSLLAGFCSVISTTNILVAGAIGVAFGFLGGSMIGMLGWIRRK